MISLPTKTFQIHQGQRIAQLLLLPYHTAIGHSATQNERQDKGFGSSDMVFWVLPSPVERGRENATEVSSLLVWTGGS